MICVWIADRISGSCRRLGAPCGVGARYLYPQTILIDPRRLQGGFKRYFWAAPSTLDQQSSLESAHQTRRVWPISHIWGVDPMPRYGTSTPVMRTCINLPVHLPDHAITQTYPREARKGP